MQKLSFYFLSMFEIIKTLLLCSSSVCLSVVVDELHVLAQEMVCWQVLLGNKATFLFEHLSFLEEASISLVGLCPKQLALSVCGRRYRPMHSPGLSFRSCFWPRSAASSLQSSTKWQRVSKGSTLWPFRHLLKISRTRSGREAAVRRWSEHPGDNMHPSSSCLPTRQLHTMQLCVWARGEVVSSLWPPWTIKTMKLRK